MNVTLEDLLHAVNILGEDRDVTVDGIGSIAVCPPVKLTAAGRKYHKEALSANVVVDCDGVHHSGSYISDDEEIDAKAWYLLKSLAGNCYEGAFAAWFEGEDAELI